MPHLQLNGVRIAYSDTGVGDETIVFSHGLLWSSAMFEPQIRELSKRYRCIAFDFRGQGDSEVCENGYDIETLCDDAWGLIETLTSGPVHWVGLSMGGFVGQRMAVYHPELIKSLTLLCTAADPEPRRNMPKYTAMLATFRATRSTRLLSGAISRIMLAPSTRKDPDRRHVVERASEQFRSLDSVGVGRAVAGVIRRRDFRHMLGRIQAPTKVVAGAEDQAISAGRSQELADGIAGAHYQTVPRVGHTMTLEAPEAVTEAVAGFIASVD